MMDVPVFHQFVAVILYFVPCKGYGEAIARCCAGSGYDGVFRPAPVSGDHWAKSSDCSGDDCEVTHVEDGILLIGMIAKIWLPGQIFIFNYRDSLFEISIL